MKKKLLSLALTCTMALSLAACGQTAPAASGSAAVPPPRLPLARLITWGLFSWCSTPLWTPPPRGFQDALD